MQEISGKERRSPRAKGGSACARGAIDAVDRLARSALAEIANAAAHVDAGLAASQPARHPVRADGALGHPPYVVKGIVAHGVARTPQERLVQDIGRAYRNQCVDDPMVETVGRRDQGIDQEARPRLCADLGLAGADV